MPRPEHTDGALRAALIDLHGAADRYLEAVSLDEQAGDAPGHVRSGAAGLLRSTFVALNQTMDDVRALLNGDT